LNFFTCLVVIVFWPYGSHKANPSDNQSLWQIGTC
jgi:hypothetical protein